MSEPVETDWRLKLRYGQLQTPFKHYTVLAEGVAGQLSPGFSCRPGRAWMAMKTWASSGDESMDMIQAIGEQIGFKVTGKIYLYDTEPSEPPREEPFGYGITFTPFDS